MRTPHVVSISFVTTICAILLSLPFGESHADHSRAEIIALYAKLYGPENAEHMYEEARVSQIVKGFCQRINFRDVISLTGKMEGDPSDHVEANEALIEDTGISVGSPARKTGGYDHLGSPQRRNYVTTIEQDRSITDRKKLRADLLDRFLHMPANVRVDFETKQLLISGAYASVELQYSFRALEIETDKTRPLTSRPPASVMLRLRKDRDYWLVENFADIMYQLIPTVERR